MLIELNDYIKYKWKVYKVVGFFDIKDISYLILEDDLWNKYDAPAKECVKLNN